MDSFGYKFNADMASTAIHAAGGGHFEYGAFDGVKQATAFGGTVASAVGGASAALGGAYQKVQGLRTAFLPTSQPVTAAAGTMTTSVTTTPAKNIISPSSTITSSSLNSSLGMATEVAGSRAGSIITEATGFASRLGAGVAAMSFMPTSIAKYNFGGFFYFSHF